MNKKNEISTLHIEHFVKSLLNYLLSTTYRKPAILNKLVTIPIVSEVEKIQKSISGFELLQLEFFTCQFATSHYSARNSGIIDFSLQTHNLLYTHL